MSMLSHILPAVIALGVLGAVLGLVLWYASRKFFVAVDGRVDEIAAALPGINCGACGFPGCAGFAAAVAAGRAPVDACIPGGATVATAVAHLMGQAAPAGVERHVAVCTCQKQGVVEAADYRGLWSCQAANAASLSGGSSNCRFGCLGYGDCVGHCPAGALEIGPAGRPIIVDEEACIGCARCVRACPRGLMAMLPVSRTVAVACHNQDKGVIAAKTCEHACIACRKCERACPADAIHVEGALARIDYGKCVLCGACVDACPKKVIRHLGRERAANGTSLTEMHDA